MVIKRTSTVDVSIQALSPLLTVGAAAAGAAFSARVGSTKSAVRARAATPASPTRISVFNVMVELLFASFEGSQRSRIGLTGANSHGVIDVVDEDLAVTDLAGFGRGGNGVDNFAGLVAWNGDLD